MAQDTGLEAIIVRLCDEANVMVFANLLDTKKALVLRKRLLECADQARNALHDGGEQKLRRAADELARRFPLGWRLKGSKSRLDG